MLLTHLQFPPITAIELCDCFKISNGLMVTSLSSFLPVLQLSSEDGMYFVMCLSGLIHNPQHNYSLDHA